ncbi:helix-turn-helix domain-containing protein [Novosphingobium taihuense]|uniref:DNA-binding CsgD family transcriptional regulator n=1 Tax=Novosphingobium taihuense TaxID=260085 RepID=A0A7W7AGC2_9SPHN|nr:DUF4019 domain-containing protein [Novosphingobium taihuense]MBB4615735.1 DNA-binding CsgD family transcriptional regulator [Novosphingobium taihuense]
MARKLHRFYSRQMISGYAALTEKEKETLRLLLGGHDAKSIARHLGLSVHTIHERLRDARRKLGTASSREAARLIQQIEAQDPELLGDKPFGDAATLHAVHQVGQPDRIGTTSRRRSWIIGGLAMTISLAMLALAALSGTNQTPAASTDRTAAVVPTMASEQAAVEAARSFLILLDRDDWPASWQATHKSFQLLNTVEWWATASEGVRERVGKPIRRELGKADFTPAPPNGYWTVTFKARYSKAGDVTETVQLASQDGGWKVASIAVE